MQSGAINWSTASLAEATARTPKATPHPTNPASVVSFTSSESDAGLLLSLQAESSNLVPTLKGIRNGTLSMSVMIIFEDLFDVANRSRSGGAFWPPGWNSSPRRLDQSEEAC